MIETSLNHFLEDTDFPYTPQNGRMGDFGNIGGGQFEGPDGDDGQIESLDGDGGQFGTLNGVGDGGETGLPDGDIDGNAKFGGKGNFGIDGDDSDREFKDGKGGRRFNGLTDGELPDGELPGKDDLGEADNDFVDDGINRNETSGGISLSGTYETAQDYIDALNAETTWVIYDSETNTAKITEIADFVSALKTASKDLGAFDALDESQGENVLFGDGDGEGDHFDAVMAELLAGSDYAAEFEEDLARTDALGTLVADRLNMYTPLYYLSDYYDGYKTSNVASYWRIRTGINQSDTALTTEVNLALALENYGADVDFETVWGQAHVEAERTGESTSNFIAWVEECCQ